MRVLKVGIVVLAGIVVGCGLLLWVRTLGPNITLEVSASAREATLPLEFTVATYNVQGRPVMDDTAAKFPQIGPRLNDFDIVGIQECFTDHEILWETTDHASKVYHPALRDPLRLVGSGLGTLAYFGVVHAAGINFRALGDRQNWPASKGVLMTRFELDGHTLDVYNTHLVAGGGEDSMVAKMSQVEEIIGFIIANSPPAHSVILMGDFNMRPLRQHHLDEAREAGYDPPESGIDAKIMGFARLREGLPGFLDASEEINGIPGAEIPEDAQYIRKGREDIDRILFRAGEGVSLAALAWHKHIEDFRGEDGELLSDHDPISVRFRLEAL